MTISVENGCEYCIVAHSLVADAMSKVSPAVTDAIRDRKPIPDFELPVLAAFTRTMVANCSLPADADVQAFLRASYEEKHILEIILTIAVKTLSNYANQLFTRPSSRCSQLALTSAACH